MDMFRSLVGRFDDELELVRRIYDLPAPIRNRMQMMNVVVSISTDENYDEMAQESTRLCEEGNRLYNIKSGKRDVLGACRLFTRAIFAAPEDSVTLALAHAGRAMSLQEYGYFRQAYDDCVCALELRYPEHLRPNIVARQATCALHLGKVAQVRRHLEDLEAMPPNESVAKNVRELREQLAEFLRQQKDDKAVQGQKTAKEEKLAMQKRQQIKQSPGPAGRFMVATQAIGQHELIFSDCAASFVPIEGQVMCQQCAAKEFIPFPCKRCRSLVIYCSPKCRAAHAKIHAIECAGYRLGLFSEISSFEHLAFRMMFEGLPQVVSHLRCKRNAQLMWTALVGKDKDSVAANDSVAYAQTLRLIHHLHSMDQKELLCHILHVDVLLVYLKKRTGFFKITEGTAATRRDWELVTAALILRHIGQVRANAFTYDSLVRKGFKDSLLLCDALWKAPLRIQCGRLNQLNYYQPVALAIFPYLSMCNHACERSLALRFSGRNMHAFALKEIGAAAAITHCYSENVCNSKRQSRRQNLKATFNFDCVCEKCEKADPDEDYKKFHRYRCDNLKCHQIFVPYLPQEETLSWWQKMSTGRRPRIKCTVCGVEQGFKFMEKFDKLIGNARKPATRRLIYILFDELDNWLVGQHELKMLLATNLLRCCFEINADGSRLAEIEFTKLIQISKILLSFIGTRFSDFSLEYAGEMTFLWDLIALGKYKCTRDEMQPMLRAVDLLSDEFRTMFMNYYTDYIEPLLLD